MSDDDSRKRSEALARVLGPGTEELTCEECFEQLDRYVELTLGGANAEEQVPGMSAHLKGCPACAEDFQSLREMLLAES